ncbi:ATPase BadF/BadG/BcrA/BcrD type domain-containing protein OS=Lysinibacillus sphaericus OX=1421 GN=LS41612_22140 PE=4 SV=1 [Lysinibacillus sphaericus]
MIGIESATEILRALLSKARVFLQEQAISKIAVATFAMAGIDSPKDHLNVTAMVHEAITAEQLDIHTLIVENDAQATLLGVTEGQAGALLIAGTGAIANVFDGQQIARTGGWGHCAGDEGSGYWLGQEVYVPFFGWKMAEGKRRY